MTISVIIPTLNEESALPTTLERTFRLGFDDIIVADGGSIDHTRDIVVQFAMSQERDAIRDCPVLSIITPPGRGLQMNTAAELSLSDVLLFLHADTILPDHARRSIADSLQDPRCVGGRFDVEFDRRTNLGRLVSTMLNLRSRMSGIATGDQAIFVRREVFERIGAYPAIRLMEDIALTRALKRESPPLRIAKNVVTSGRRWEKHGVARTILLMWRLRLAYTFGADPDELAMRYVPHK
jgi:rSAM/selenodomain-associated transferase 2